MKLAFSSIAWEKQQDREVASLLREGGVSAVEIAPGKVWPQPAKVSEKEAAAYRKFWEDEGVPIRAMQSLLFGHPELVLFGDAGGRKALLEYLTAIILLAERLGARAVVFGSPKNRAKGPLSREAALQIAVPFFQSLGKIAADHGVAVCLEANAREYQCDFILTTDEAASLVQAVDSPGFHLHLDWGCMDLAQENVLQQIARFGAKALHFHLSSYRLQAITDRKRAKVQAIVDAFSKTGSPAMASVEMLNPKGDLEVMRAVLREIGPCFQGG